MGENSEITGFVIRAFRGFSGEEIFYEDADKVHTELSIRQLKRALGTAIGLPSE